MLIKFIILFLLAVNVMLEVCFAKNEVLSYSMPEGQSAQNGEIKYKEINYTGITKNGVYKDGVGLLLDGKIGPVDSQKLNGTGWVGWFETLTKPYGVNITFEFEEIRKLRFVLISTNVNSDSHNTMFEKTRVFFSKIKDNFFDNFYLEYYHKREEGNRNVVVELLLCENVGKFVKLQLFPRNGWILISEILFASVKVDEQVDVNQTELKICVAPNGYGPSNPEESIPTPQFNSRAPRSPGSSSTISRSILISCVVILLLCVIAFLVLLCGFYHCGTPHFVRKFFSSHFGQNRKNNEHCGQNSNGNENVAQNSIGNEKFSIGNKSPVLANANYNDFYDDGIDYELKPYSTLDEAVKGDVNTYQHLLKKCKPDCVLNIGEEILSGETELATCATRPYTSLNETKRDDGNTYQDILENSETDHEEILRREIEPVPSATHLYNSLNEAKRDDGNTYQQLLKDPMC